MNQEIKVVGHVYRIINEKTGSFYIGGTANIKNRYRTHMRDLSNGKHHSFVFQEEYNEHGKDAFRLEILGEYPKDELRAAEQDHIDKLQPRLNISKSACCGDLLSYHPHRDAIIKKRSKTLADKLSHMTTEEKNAAYGRPGEENPMFGRTHTKGARKKISDANKGNAYALGTKKTEAQKAAISERAKLRTGDKNPFFGREHSQETKRKLSEANKGSLPGNARKVSANGTLYESVTSAARNLKVSPMLVIYRIKNSPRFGIYQYVN